MPGFVTTPPIVQTAPPPTRLRDLAELELELRGAGERVAALVHRRRAGVRGLAAERDEVALDAEGAEHDAERQVERLEHRPLLDVELEVRRRVLELRCAPRARGRGRRRARRARRAARCRRASRRSRSSSWSAIEPAAAEEPKSERPKRAPSSSAQLTSRTVSGGVPSSAIRRSTSTPASDVEAAVEPAAVRHRVDVAAEQERALRGARQREPLVPGLVDLLLGARRRDLLAQPLARALPRLGPRDALRAVLVAGQLLQLAELGDGPFR